MSSLKSLPGELLCHIGNHLGDKDLSHFAQANAHLSKVLGKLFLKRTLMDKPARIVRVSALMWAIDYGHAKLVDKIIIQPGFNRFRPAVKSALLEAAANGNCEIINALLNKGYEVNQWGTQNQALHYSAMNGHAAAVKCLIDRGANISARNERGETAFQEAVCSPWKILQKEMDASRGQITLRQEIKIKAEIEARVVSTLAMLVNNGAFMELHQTDRSGDSPPHHAVYGFCLDSEHDINFGTGILKFFLDNGVSHMNRNEEGYTPYELAVLPGLANRTVLNFYLNNGISANELDPSGVSLLAHAFNPEPGAVPVVELLLNRGARASDIDLFPFFNTVEIPEPLIFDKLLTLILIHGGRFRHQAGRCFTIAAFRGWLDTMKTIFHEGDVDINMHVTQDEGEEFEGTPLSAAIEMERADIIRFLVENGVEMSEAQEVEVGEILGANSL